METPQQGIVVKSTGKEYLVRDSEGKLTRCRLRGQFRIKGIKSTNPIAVGDRVRFLAPSDHSSGAIAGSENNNGSENGNSNSLKKTNSRAIAGRENGSGSHDSSGNHNGSGSKSSLPEKDRCGVITDIEERKNYISRKSIKLSKISHIIAANVDQLILVVSLSKPITPLGFIDRFLTAAESFRIKSCLVFNKTDLYEEQERQKMRQWRGIYEKAGYPCLEVSATQREGLEALKERMRDKISLLGGQSGVGKSTLINAISPHLQLKTGVISDSYEKGKHTTTFAEMFPLDFGGDIIDTPGIKEFGLIQYEKEEVGHYFPEILSRLEQCKFSNCTHTHEPQCAVKRAVENGEIAASRYQNYLSIIENEDLNLKDWMLE